MLLSLTQAWRPIEVAREFIIRGHDPRDRPAYFFALQDATCFGYGDA